MSKKSFNKLDAFLETEPDDKNLMDFVSELVLSNDPTYKTIATRYSNIKKYLRENYIGISEDTLKKLKPDDKIIQSIIESDAEKKNNKKNIHFNKNHVNDLLELKNSTNVYDKGIYLQFISGRRINEIFDEDIKLTMLKNAPYKVKFSSLSKKSNDKPYVIQLVPDITARQFRDEVYKLRKIVNGISLNDWNKRVNKRIKDKLGKDFTSHNLRGMYGVYLFNAHNEEDQNINGFISKVLNHDSSDASLHYSNYIYKE